MLPSKAGCWSEPMSASQPIHALKQLSTIIAVGASLEDVFNTALEQMVQFMEADTGSIQLLTDEGLLHTVAVHGEIAQRLYGEVTAFAVSDSGLQLVLDSDHAHVISHLTATLALNDQLAGFIEREQLDTAVFIALRVKGESIGTLSVAYHEPRRISRQRIAWFEAMTNLISISLFNTQLLNDLQAKQTALQEAWKAVTDAQEVERRRLSRELHDEVGQALTSLMLRLKALQTETDVELITDRLNGLRYLTGKTLEEVRRISMDLHPVVFDELGLIPAIRAFVRERSALTKTEITFQTVGRQRSLRPEIEIACYRAVQEGLTNIIRHANAQQARVELNYDNHAVRLTIADDGVGMPLQSEQQGVGLLGMLERVRLAGGSMSVDSIPGSGVFLTIIFPNAVSE
jgi:two-component system NarL family sensor kinase